MKEALMAKKPIKKETKANREREEGRLPGEEPRRRRGGREVIVPAEVAWQRDSSKSELAAERQGKPGPSRSLSITLQSS